MNHFTMSAGFRRPIAMSKKLIITNKNREALIDKAVALCNAAVPLSQVLARLRISYRQFLSLSKHEKFKDKAGVLFRQGYKSSPVWQGAVYLDKKREFTKTALGLGMSVKMVAWILNVSTRSVYRYKNHQN